MEPKHFAEEVIVHPKSCSDKVIGSLGLKKSVNHQPAKHIHTLALQPN